MSPSDLTGLLENLCASCSFVFNTKTIREPLEIANRRRMWGERKPAQPFTGCAESFSLLRAEFKSPSCLPDYLVGTELIVFTICATIW
jgi:hypothetical protein